MLSFPLDHTTACRDRIQRQIRWWKLPSRIAVFAVGGLSDGIALSVSCRSFVETAKSNCGL